MPSEDHRCNPEYEDYDDDDDDEQADIPSRIEPMADFSREGSTYGEGKKG